jgi:predicted CoA-binding protein
MLLTCDAELRRVLAENRSVAVLGAKSEPWEAAFSVPRYLRDHGWRVVGVNPKLAGGDWLGSPAVGALAELQPVDLIEVFRRPEALPAHAAEILALPWRPRVVWFQLGIRHDAAAERLSQAGIDVVQDRCMMPEHRRLIGG